MSRGSPGRAMMLAEDEGLKIALLVDRLLGDLPAVPVSRGYEIADVLGRSETGFSTFMDLVRAGVAAAVRDSVRGRADPEQERLVGLRSLDAWGEVWQGLTRLQDETERFSGDKRQAIVAAATQAELWGLLKQAARDQFVSATEDGSFTEVNPPGISSQP